MNGEYTLSHILEEDLASLGIVDGQYFRHVQFIVFGHILETGKAGNLFSLFFRDGFPHKVRQAFDFQWSILA